MTQKQSIAVLFYIRKAKSTKSKMAPIYMRITVNGKRAEISLQRDVEVGKWNPAAGMVAGSSETAKSLNQYITYWRQRTYDAQESLVKDGRLATADAIKQLLTGGSAKQKTLMEVFSFHNDRLLERVGIDHSPATHVRYQTTKDHVLEFMQAKYGTSDIYLSHLGKGFAADFYHYLITVRRCNVMTEILLSRYDQFCIHGLQTYLTTNLTSMDIEEQYGKRVRSRMREMFNLLAFDAKSKDKRI